MFGRCFVLRQKRTVWYCSVVMGLIRECIQKLPDWVDNEIYAYNNKHSLRSNRNRLTRRIVIQLHLVAESCTICSSRSRRPVRKLLDRSYILKCIFSYWKYVLFCDSIYLMLLYVVLLCYAILSFVLLCHVMLCCSSLCFKQDGNIFVYGREISFNPLFFRWMNFCFPRFLIQTVLTKEQCPAVINRR
jgi:hypothetical protein